LSDSFCYTDLARSLRVVFNISMKLRPAYLIISSVIVFLLDFLILANKTIFPNNTMDGFIVVAIAFVCVLVFLSGVIWAIVKSISGKTKNVASNTTTTSTKSMSTPDRFSLTSKEIMFNRLFAVLLIVSTVPLLLNILNIPTMVLFTLFALFLFFSKKYHLFINIIFLVFALGVYFVPLPIDWGLYLGLKEFRYNGFVFHQIILFFYLAPFIFVSLAVRNVFGIILSYFKLETYKHNLLYFISLIVVAITVLAYPFLDSIKLRARAMEDDDGSSQLTYVLTKQEMKIKPGESGSSSTALSRDYTAQYDSVNNKYIYRLNLEDPMVESITFTAVEVDGEKINFQTDSRVNCPHCQMGVNDPYNLVFPASQHVDFIISSNQFIKTIEFNELGGKIAKFVFWK